MKDWRMFFSFVKPYRWLVIVTLLIGAVKFAIPLLLPLLVKYVVDDILLADLTTAEKLDHLWKAIAFGMLLFVVARYPIEYYRQYFAQLTTSKILFDMRTRIWSHLQKLSLRYYQNR